ncbi:hypothetical protein AG1IA_07872 [Rhizoctonia solani AG-1 IA]|uniref:Uncharacterized protein n=1 Tax=Thanatephorus cucumeris (strain AG1-IA) TaxID=983506 RepID=L8WP32_THACA|nr:hypothetical protein AG1IA_07872 [Rhizoctonia solani AG-1 IA]
MITFTAINLLEPGPMLDHFHGTIEGELESYQTSVAYANTRGYMYALLGDLVPFVSNHTCANKTDCAVKLTAIRASTPTALRVIAMYVHRFTLAAMCTVYINHGEPPKWGFFGRQNSRVISGVLAKPDGTSMNLPPNSPLGPFEIRVSCGFSVLLGLTANSLKRSNFPSSDRLSMRQSFDEPRATQDGHTQ